MSLDSEYSSEGCGPPNLPNGFFDSLTPPQTGEAFFLLQKCVDSFIASTKPFPGFATKLWFNTSYPVSKICFNGGINADMGVRMTGKLCLLALCLLLLLPAAALAAPAAEVWVDGVKVSEAGAAMPAGVAYDAATGTLTLTDAVLTHTSSLSFHDAVIAANGDLTITLAGDSRIVASGGQYFLDGIYAEGSVTFQGDGSLSVRADGTASEQYGLSLGFPGSDRDTEVRVLGGDITLSGQRMGLYADSSYGTTQPQKRLIVEGGSLTLIGSLSYGASKLPPEFDEDAFIITASYDPSGSPAADYTPFQPGGCDYAYLKVESLTYDEYGFGPGLHYQPAVKAADGAYEIGNAGQLFWFSQQVAANDANATLNARLTKDITVPAGKVFTPIGGKTGSAYQGIFDGQGHVIDGLTINPQYGLSSTGLVSVIGQNAVVRNLRLSGVTVYEPGTSVGTVGAICGTNDGTIESCVIESGTVYALQYAGGICGQNNGTIRLCSSAADVTASGNTAGGICGMNNGTVENCLNTGDLSAGWAAGGICGQNANGATVSGCLSLGGYTSTLPGYAGGISGINYALPVNSCYLASAQGYDGARTQAQMLSGEVTWLLNGSQSAGAWGQTLDGSSMPELGGKAVYRGYTFCDGTIGYANTALSQDVPAHRFVYHQSTGGHMQVCSVCGLPSFVIEPHVLDWTMDADGHSALCALCGYTVPRAAHAMDWTANETGHSGVCTVCGYTAAHVAHTMDWTADETGHSGVCTVCGYAATHAAHTMNWTADADGHSGVCAVCGYEAAHAAHVYGDGGICEVCGYVRPVLPPKTGDGAHPGAWLVLMLASGAFALTALRRRRRA